MDLGKYSFGIGDRFGHQGEAQLKTIKKAKEKGVDIIPIWNKSHRKHMIINSYSSDTRKEAENAVKQLNFSNVYFVDTDHINVNHVNLFIESSDFFTLDVAEYIGKSATAEKIKSFVSQYINYAGVFEIPEIKQTFSITLDESKETAEKYLFTAEEAGRIY